MSGVSVGHSHPRSCSGKKTLRRCRNSKASDDVILIDVDTEGFDNVVTVDVPKPLPKKKLLCSSTHRKDENWSFKNVIYIDDEENNDTNHSFGVNNASSSAKDFPDSGSESVRLSNCKRTYSGRGSNRNRYGLNTDSESGSDSSDDDSPDCELVEDSSGKVQEQWEKASSRRKKDIQNGQFSEFETGNSNRHTMEDGVNSAICKESDKEFDHTAPVSGKSSKVEPRPSKYESRVDEESSCGESSPPEDGTTSDTSKVPVETEVNSSRSFSGEKHKNFPETDTGGAKEKGNLVLERCTSKRSTLQPKQTCRRSARLSDAVGSHNSIGSGNTIREGKAESNIQHEENEDDQLHSQSEETTRSAEISIINEREKHKETDEYKRAMAEELISRQQTLRIQAEEAKRLRQLQKRRKTESMRLLDMEKRQKERIEEVRNIQKKDEENMNMKDEIRSEVRNELKNLETSCHSMGSLLHLLGILVGGWPNPSPKEVQTAYKRALLTFHPDRASQSDIRQQVEAEEKFKLINRLKEKFGPLL